MLTGLVQLRLAVKVEHLMFLALCVMRRRTSKNVLASFGAPRLERLSGSRLQSPATPRHPRSRSNYNSNFSQSYEVLAKTPLFQKARIDDQEAFAVGASGVVAADAARLPPPGLLAFDVFDPDEEDRFGSVSQPEQETDPAPDENLDDVAVSAESSTATMPWTPLHQHVARAPTPRTTLQSPAGSNRRRLLELAFAGVGGVFQGECGPTRLHPPPSAAGSAGSPTYRNRRSFDMNLIGLPELASGPALGFQEAQGHPRGEEAVAPCVDDDLQAGEADLLLGAADAGEMAFGVALQSVLHRYRFSSGAAATSVGGFIAGDIFNDPFEDDAEDNDIDREENGENIPARNASDADSATLNPASALPPPNGALPAAAATLAPSGPLQVCDCRIGDRNSDVVIIIDDDNAMQEQKDIATAEHS